MTENLPELRDDTADRIDALQAAEGGQSKQEQPAADAPAGERRLPEDAIAILPVRNTLLFPTTVQPLGIGRERSIAAAQYAARTQSPIGVLLQRDPEMAERLFQKAIEQTPDAETKSWSYVYLGRLAQAAGDPARRPEAEKFYRAALAVEAAPDAAKAAAQSGLEQSLKLQNNPEK